MWIIPCFFAFLWGKTEYLYRCGQNKTWGWRFGLWDLFHHFLTFLQTNQLIAESRQAMNSATAQHQIQWAFFMEDILNGGNSQVRIIKLMMGWIPISCLSFKVQASCILARCHPHRDLAGNLSRAEAFFVPVLFLLRQVKMSAVRKGSLRATVSAHTRSVKHTPAV